MLKTVRQLLFNNFWTKVSSVLLAVLIWFYVSGEENVEFTKAVPIKIKLGKNLAVTGVSVRSTIITLKGPREALKNADLQKLCVSKDLSNVSGPGSVTFQVAERDINCPKFTTVTHIAPSDLTVTVDALTEKEMPVAVALRSKPAEGYVVEKVVSNPELVKVTGPRSTLEKTAKLNTMPIDLTGRNSSFSQKIAAEKILGRFGYAEPIEVTVTIKEQSEQKLFEKIPVAILRSAFQKYDVSIEPGAADITITGPLQIVPRVEAKNIQCYVDVQNLKDGEYELPVQTSVPKDVSVITLVPANVKVKVKAETVPVRTIMEKQNDKKEGL